MAASDALHPGGPPRTPDHLLSLRSAVRAFLDGQRAMGAFAPRCDAWQRGYDPAFSRALGERGWVGMTLPARYGGAGASALERFVVAEELLAAGAPVGYHWMAERQIAPAILALGTEAQRERFLPAIARGELCFGLGMSEPNSGSDLASVRTRARPVDGGWSLTGQKIWTTGAHVAEYLLVLRRTSEEEDRHGGLSQLIVDTKAPGVDVRPIATMDDEEHFCEVFLDEVLVPGDCLLGAPGDGWGQVTTELAYERGGPERYLTTFPLLEAYVRSLPAGARVASPLGALAAELVALRCLGAGVARAIDDEQRFVADAALHKDAGTEFERRVVDVLRTLGADALGSEVSALLDDAQLVTPVFTLRGGTTEILRGIVGRELMAA